MVYLVEETTTTRKAETHQRAHAACSVVEANVEEENEEVGYRPSFVRWYLTTLFFVATTVVLVVNAAAASSP